MHTSVQAQAKATGMPTGIVTPLNTYLLATPPPPPFSVGTGPLGFAPTGDGPAVGPVTPPQGRGGMSDGDIALVGVALGLGVLVLLVGIIAALLTIRHHFLRLERQRQRAADSDRDKPSSEAWDRRKVCRLLLPVAPLAQPPISRPRFPRLLPRGVHGSNHRIVVVPLCACQSRLCGHSHTVVHAPVTGLWTARVHVCFRQFCCPRRYRHPCIHELELASTGNQLLCEVSVSSVLDASR